MPVKILSIAVPIGSLIRHPALHKARLCVDSRISGNVFAALKKKRYDAVIIGASVPQNIRNRLASEVKSANPNAVVIMLYNGSINHAEMADAVLNAATIEHNLAEAMVHLLGIGEEKARRAEKTRVSNRA